MDYLKWVLETQLFFSRKVASIFNHSATFFAPIISALTSLVFPALAVSKQVNWASDVLLVYSPSSLKNKLLYFLFLSLCISSKMAAPQLLTFCILNKHLVRELRSCG